MDVISLDTLQQLGAFTGAPVERDISWRMKGKPYKAKVFIRPLCYQSAIADLRTLSENGDGAAARIATSICDAEGKQVFTVADITGEADPARGPLDGNLTMALLAAIAGVNGLGKAKATPS